MWQSTSDSDSMKLFGLQDFKNKGIVLKGLKNTLKMRLEELGLRLVEIGLK